MWWIDLASADALDPDFVETCFESRCAGESTTCKGAMDKLSAAPPEHPDPATVHREECLKLESEGWTSVCRAGQSPWQWTEVMCKPDTHGVLTVSPSDAKSAWCATSASTGLWMLGLVCLWRRKKA